MTAKNRIESRIIDSENYVFLRKDFEDIVGYDQIGKILRQLVEEGKLLKVGYGVYTKTRINSINGRIMPASPGGNAGIIAETLKRFNVNYKLTGAAEEYNSGRSTQVPNIIEFKLLSRFSRKLIIGGSSVNV